VVLEDSAAPDLAEKARPFVPKIAVDKRGKMTEDSRVTKNKTRRSTMKKQTDYVLPPGKVLVMRTCDKDMRGYGGFQWPESGPVECPDWDPAVQCGGGLHGLLWGEGSGDLLAIDEPEAKWLIVEVDFSYIVDLTATGSVKCKFQRGVVVFVGNQYSATKWLSEHGGQGRAIIGGTSTAGHRGTATAGDGGTSTAGHRGTATAGDGGTSTAGHRGTATAGHRGTATAGDGGTSTAGIGGTSTAGHRGTATAGDGGTATAGDGGTATAGHRGTATAGDGGTAKTGEVGIIVLSWWDNKSERYRLSVGYVGEDGIEANTFYRCDDSGKLVKA